MFNVVSARRFININARAVFVDGGGWKIGDEKHERSRWRRLKYPVLCPSWYLFRVHNKEATGSNGKQTATMTMMDIIFFIAIRRALIDEHIMHDESPISYDAPTTTYPPIPCVHAISCLRISHFSNGHWVFTRRLVCVGLGDMILRARKE